MTALLNSLFASLSPLWEMSLTAAYVTAVVALLRLILKKRAPKQVLCLLWLVVFARLLVPVSLESPLSILPDAGQVQLAQEPPSKLAGDGQSAPGQKPTQDYEPEQNPAQNHSGATADPVSQGNLAPGAGPVFPALAAPEDALPSASQVNPREGFPWRALLAGIWLTGVLTMGGYGTVSYLRLRRRLFDAIRTEDGAWEHPSVGSPFILGILRPKIYLPAGLYGTSRQFILCHEQAHLRRLDHIVKPLCWAALALHWFNPAVWAAFVLMSRDIESACDEAVIRQLGQQVKADYSATLLSLATNGRVPAPCPLAFDEGNAKGRIQNVLRYRRPALWVVVVSFLMAVMAAVCLLTNPVAGEALDSPGPGSPAPESSASQPPEASASQAPETGPARLSYPLPTVPDWAAEVLSGKRKFYSTYLKKQMGLQPLNAAYGYPDSYFDLDYKLALVDLDGDGADEVILEPCYIGTPMDESDNNLYDLGYLILRRQGDDVYSYNPPYRGFYQLKTDGTFVWSGAGDWGTASARFSDSGFEADGIAWCQSTELEEEFYFVDGLAVGLWEFDAAVSAQNAKPAPTWYRWYEDTGLLPAIVGADQSTFTPKFLGDGMRELYRQASYFYYHLFGESTVGICDLDTPSYWPSGGYDSTDTVERDALTYVRATGQFARWADLMAAADALFTRNFWNTCNIWDGHELFINVDGDTYFLPASRVSGDYFRADLNPFKLVEQTDAAVTVTLTVGYDRYRTGESEEEWSQRASLSSDYTIDYPIRLVRTENGWRFDEFHHGRTDHREYILGHILWQTDPLKAVNGWMDEAVLRQVGPEVFLDWDRTTYQIEPDINHSTFTGRMYVLDVDGDGQTEASLVYLDGKDSPVIAVYERTGQGLRRHTFHVSRLLNWYDTHISVEQNPEGGLTLTYRAPGDITSIELSDGVFEGYDWLREDEIHAEMSPAFFYVGLAVEAPLTPPFGTHSFISLSDGVNSGPYVASAGFQVEYDGGGFTIGKLWWEPYVEFTVPDL